MRIFEITINEKYFNMLWRSISERENVLESNIKQAGLNSDDAALIGNDLVYLRLCKKELAEKASHSKFSESVFSLDEDYIDLSDL